MYWYLHLRCTGIYTYVYGTREYSRQGTRGGGDARNILGYVYPGYCVHKFKFKFEFKFEFKFSPIFTSRDGEMQIQF
eukprot:SAG11_NODE_17324_length_521_cov_2.914692_1_plen_76_part_10